MDHEVMKGDTNYVGRRSVIPWPELCERHIRVMNYKKTRLSIFSYGILTFLLLGYLLHVHVPLRPTYSWPPPELSYDYEKQELLDQDQICQFANLNPFDPQVLPHIADAKPIRCKQRFPTLTQVDADGWLRFNRTALLEAGYGADSSSPPPSCTYRPVVRTDGDDDEVSYGEASGVLPAAGLLLPPEAEFVAVDCVNFVGVSVYSNLHALVTVKRNLTAGEAPAGGGAGGGGGADGRLNVVFVVIDSLSHSNAVRQLPKTYAYLTRDLGATVLRGFTTVGDNTYPNLAALLSGRQTVLFPELVQQNGAAGTNVFRHQGAYDNATLLFNELKRRRGYATLLAEDVTTFSIFNYYADGFVKPPTDHYFRPFWLALESHTQHYMSSNLCFGSRPKHLLQLEYLENFMRAYHEAKVPYFAFAVFTEICHDFINQVGATDGDFASFLERIAGGESGLLNDTVFVMMGDHGHRLGSILETPVGRMEKRRPFAAVFLPERVRRAHPDLAKQLRTNGKRLTNVFDLHRTVLQATSSNILRPEEMPDGGDSSSGVATVVAGSRFGASLLGPIPASRSCPEAGIAFQFCACDRETSVSTDDPRVREAGLAIVQAINNFTDAHRTQCTVLSLERITGAVILLPHDIDTRHGRTDQPLPQPTDFLYGGSGDFKLRVTVMASPSGGLFEAMVLMSGDEDNTLTVAPGISRMNVYGSQPDCLLRQRLGAKSTSAPEGFSILKTYCYCKSNLPFA